MKIQTKCSADIVGLSIKRNKARDGREAYVDLEIGVKQEDAEEKFGADFETLGFSTMQLQEGNGEDDSGQRPVFLLDHIKPGSRVKCERHVILIDGEKVAEQPLLVGLRTVDGEARVVACVRVPIDVGRKKLLGHLTQHVGELVEVEFNPEQLETPGSEG